MLDLKDPKQGKMASDAKSTTDSTPFTAGGTRIASNNPLGGSRGKLKLDLGGMPNKPKNLKLPLGELLAQQPNNPEPLGFHDEFMSKLNEFSLSWRLEAMNQRNF